MTDSAIFTIVAALELGSNFLKNITRDKDVESAYTNLITVLEEKDIISPVLFYQLARYQVEIGELLMLLKKHMEASSNPEILVIAQGLLSAMGQATEKAHMANLQRMQLAYNYHVDEQRAWSRFGMGVAFLGFFLIFVGIASIYLVSITIGIVTTMAGLAVNLSSGLFFRQASNAATQANNKYEKLIELENIRSSAEMLSSLSARLSNVTS